MVNTCIIIMKNKLQVNRFAIIALRHILSTFNKHSIKHLLYLQAILPLLHVDNSSVRLGRA